MMIKGVIFDLDGTLLDTLADIAYSENCALAELGLTSLPVDEYRWIVGGGANDIAQRLLPPNQQSEQSIRTFVERFRFYYHQNWHKQTTPYDGIMELLNILKERQIPIAILSNKPEEFTLKIVNFFFPDSTTFTHVYGQAKGIPTKPNPVRALQIAADWQLNPSDIGFLGDSDIDVFTAHNAGMISIGAAWGFRGSEELIASGAQILLRHPLDLVEYLN